MVRQLACTLGLGTPDYFDLFSTPTSALLSLALSLGLKKVLKGGWVGTKMWIAAAFYLNYGL